MNLHDFQSEVAEWHTRNFGPVDSWKPLMIMFEEGGELAHAHMKALQGIRTDEDHQADKVDAIGDIVIALAAYCGREGLNLDTCIERTWARVSKRDWKADPSKGGE